MKLFEKLSLGGKVIAIVFIGIVVLTSMITFSNELSLQKNMNKEFEDRIAMLGESLASGLAEQLSVLLSFNDESVMQSMTAPLARSLQGAVAKDDVVYVGILRSNGATLVSANNFKEGDFSIISGSSAGRQLSGKYPVSRVKHGGEENYEIRVPIVKDNAQLGELVLGYSTARIRGAISAAIVKSLLIGIIGSLLISTVIFLAIKRIVSNPLREVIEVAGRVANGDLSQKPIAARSSDEVGALATIFNKMLQSLREMIDKLDDANQKAISENLEEYFKVLSALSVGDLNVSANEKVVNEVFRQLGHNTNRMIESLKTLATAAELVAEGDLRTQIRTRSGKDVLATAFAKMAANLKNLIGSITSLAGKTYNSANDVARTSNEAYHTMQSVQNAIRQIANATAQIAKNTQEILYLVQNANKTVDVGSHNISKVIDKFNTVQVTIEKTERAVNKLNQMSKEISEIVGFITKISDQTNLLSLNAAIEAARAGEAGRGFAVVADEVRKLAESSGHSADRISNIIREIQQDTAGVVTSSQESLQESKVVLELANNMQAGYNEIVDAIKKISSEVEQISAIAEETASSSEEISSSADEQANAITAISTNAKDLVGQVDKLNSEVGKFKL